MAENSAFVIPETYDFGSGPVVEVSYLQQVFGIKRLTAFKYLRSFHIKPLYIGRKAFFSLETFRRILFVITRPGGPGFLFPGTYYKHNARYKDEDKIPTEVTDEIVATASDPKTILEMSALSGDGAALRKLAGLPQEDSK